MNFVGVLYDRWLAIVLGQGRCHIEFYVDKNEAVRDRSRFLAMVVCIKVIDQNDFQNFHNCFLSFDLLKIYWKDVLSSEQLYNLLNTLNFYPYTALFSFMSKNKYDILAFLMYLWLTYTILAVYCMGLFFFKY